MSILQEIFQRKLNTRCYAGLNMKLSIVIVIQLGIVTITLIGWQLNVKSTILHYMKRN